MFKIPEILKKILIIFLALIAVILLLSGALLFLTLKGMNDPSRWIYCGLDDDVPYAEYSETELHPRFQRMYEKAYNNNGVSYKLQKIIAPKNISIEDYYNNLYKFSPSGSEFFVTDKGEIVSCGPAK